MKFEFSIRKTIKEAWEVFKTAPWFFIGLTIIMLVINFAGGDRLPFAVSLALAVVTMIAGLLLSYVWTSASLAGVDGKTELLTFKKFGSHLPTFRGFLKYLGVIFLSALFSSIAFVPFIILGFYVMSLFTSGIYIILGALPFAIPGAYIAIRLAFAPNVYVDRKTAVIQSLRDSWHMIRGDVFWTVLLTGIVCFFLIILGIVMVLVGFFVMYPITMIVMVSLYRKLSLHGTDHTVIVQPEELVAPDAELAS